jgi:hypothetical protein
MNVKNQLIVAALISFTAIGCAPSANQAGPSPALNLEKLGFKTPESVMYNAKEDVYLVSNINVDGIPTKKDNNGFISKLAPDGTVLNLKWIAGGANDVTLNAPKGMAIVGGTLYVTDLDTVHELLERPGRWPGRHGLRLGYGLGRG